MQATLKTIHDNFVTDNLDNLQEAYGRADATQTANMNLGESMTARFLAATGFASGTEAIGSAVVIKSLKRSALIRVGCLLYYFNRYGVATCTVPSGLSGRVNALAFVMGPELPLDVSNRLVDTLGITKDWNGRDYIYDYSQCPIGIACSSILQEDAA